MTKRLAKKIVWKAGHGYPYRRLLLKRAVVVYRREVRGLRPKWLATGHRPVAVDFGIA